MEDLTRLVTESMARHGFDRPLDYRRLQWSRWFRCESHHSLLFVPSKPGVFALAEEIMDLSSPTPCVATATSAVPRSEASGATPKAARSNENEYVGTAALGCPVPEERQKRMLAVTQFFEDDDMAFVLDRMLSRNSPMRPRLESGRYFVRFVVIEDQSQRRSICSALNQWIVSSSEKATDIGSHFASSLELTEQPNVGRTLLSATADAISPQKSSTETSVGSSTKPTPLEVIAARNVHAFPSGF